MGGAQADGKKVAKMPARLETIKFELETISAEAITLAS